MVFTPTFPTTYDHATVSAQQLLALLLNLNLEVNCLFFYLSVTYAEEIFDIFAIDFTNRMMEAGVIGKNGDQTLVHILNHMVQFFLVASRNCSVEGIPKTLTESFVLL